MLATVHFRPPYGCKHAVRPRYDCDINSAGPVLTIAVNTQMFKAKTKTLISRTKTHMSKDQKLNSINCWFKNHYSRNRVTCSHENCNLMTKL